MTPWRLTAVADERCALERRRMTSRWLRQRLASLSDAWQHLRQQGGGLLLRNIELISIPHGNILPSFHR
uniref:Uncharacterized protein n=1 Tax=Oryza punctata TaxID=4537 RepID=A0A0E0LBP1_ORYPU